MTEQVQGPIYSHNINMPATKFIVTLINYKKNNPFQKNNFYIFNSKVLEKNIVTSGEDYVVCKLGTGYIEFQVNC